MNGWFDLVVLIYKSTETFPSEEKFGLTSQIRRASVSIPSNIAEGAGRNTNGEFRQFLGIANGSCYELQTQLIISNKLNLIDEKTLAPLLSTIDELQKMNYTFQNTLKNKKQTTDLRQN